MPWRSPATKSVAGASGRCERCAELCAGCAGPYPGRESVKGLRRLPTQGAFPHRGDPPSFFLEGDPNGSVSLQVALELLSPEIRTSRWRGGVSASRMTMPEAAMDEDGGLPARQDEIGAAPQRSGVEPEPESCRMQMSPDQQLRTRVGAADA